MITEPAIAERAAEHISGDELDALKENISAMEACGDDTEHFVKLDIGFHDIIARASRNKVFRLMREPISLLFLPAGQTILPTIKTYERVIEAHRKIYAALLARDKAVAYEWMTRHMADFRRGYLRTGANPDKPLRPPHEDGTGSH
jgi:DNA-binding FadR family transcriptional regulator